jgi:hypothetical protein
MANAMFAGTGGRPESASVAARPARHDQWTWWIYTLFVEPVLWPLFWMVEYSYLELIGN